MIRWIFYICLTIVTVSCGDLLKSTPQGLLDENQMTNILVDMHLTEATLRSANDSILKLNDTTQLRIRYAEVFRKHKIRPEDFNMSLNYYIERIDILDNIYTNVINQLTVIETNFQELLNKQTLAAADSANRTNPFNNTWYRTLYKGEIKNQYFDSLPAH